MLGVSDCPIDTEEELPSDLLIGQSPRMIIQAEKLFRLMKKCEDMEDLSFAVRSVIENLHNWKVSLNIVTYNLFLEACVDARRMDNVNHIFQVSRKYVYSLSHCLLIFLFVCFGCVWEYCLERPWRLTLTSFPTSSLTRSFLKDIVQ